VLGIIWRGWSQQLSLVVFRAALCAGWHTLRVRRRGSVCNREGLVVTRSAPGRVRVGFSARRLGIASLDGGPLPPSSDRQFLREWLPDGQPNGAWQRSTFSCGRCPVEASRSLPLGAACPEPSRRHKRPGFGSAVAGPCHPGAGVGQCHDGVIAFGSWPVLRHPAYLRQKRTHSLGQS